VLHNGKAEKVRLAEIDCPERRQAYGKKAKEFVADLAAGELVTVEVRTQDRYGRTVGEVFLPDGTSLNREIIRSGYAWWYRKYSTDSSLGELEREAREAKRGLWADSHPMPPWVYRRRSK
jgi:endonuclease YncB( thermonuclease family)